MANPFSKFFFFFFCQNYIKAEILLTTAAACFVDSKEGAAGKRGRRGYRGRLDTQHPRHFSFGGGDINQAGDLAVT